MALRDDLRWAAKGKWNTNLGWEVELNALPGDCNIVQLASENKFPLPLFQFVGYYFRLRRDSATKAASFARGDEEYQAFADCLERMISKSPGIEFRHCDLYRRGDWLRWLLRQVSSESDLHLANASIDGESIVADDARSSQGFHFRWNTSETCQFIREWIDAIPESALHRSYDPEAMGKAGLYKWRQTSDRSQVYERILLDFRTLRDFYNRVSDRNEAVIIITD